MNIMDRLASSRKFYRFLESVPGLITWTLILGPLALVRYKPNWVAYFVLTYSVYWVYNSFKFVTYSYIGHKKLLYVVKHDWLRKLEERFPDQWENYYYCGLIPFASEPISVVRPTIESIVNSNYPNDRKILCLSSEKAVPKGKEIAEQLAEEFKDKFAHIFITEHELKPGEVKGKAANENHAGRFLYEKLKEVNIDPEYVLLTSNDADMLNHRQYHAYLLYKFLLEDKEYRHKRIYQPVPIDYTDLWNANFFSRLMISLGLNLQLSLHQRNNYRRTVYSFYSMSMKTLKEIDFWDVDLIPEDDRTMFKAIYTYGHDFKVVPLFIPASGRPIHAPSKWMAFKEQYAQVRRWTWGASEMASSFTKALKYKNIPWRVKLLPIFNQLRTHVEWATASVIPLLGGTIPLLLNEEFRKTTLAFTLPSILSVLMQISALGLIIIMYVEWKIAPIKPKERGIWFKLSTFAQWILLPYVGFALNALPALEAQTRLIFNKRIIYVEAKKGHDEDEKKES